jgi:hypothetical protein
VKNVIDDSYNSQYENYQELLKAYSKNYDTHSATYNQAFDDLIYKNACNYMTYIKYIASSNLNITIQDIKVEECKAVNGGIMQKGVYNSVVKFWTQL